MRRQVDVKEAAKILGRSRDWVRRLARENVIPSIRSGRRYLFVREDVESLLGSADKRSVYDQIAELKKKITDLEERVGFLSYLAGLDRTQLQSATDADLDALLKEAALALRALPHIPSKALRVWGELFVQITAEDLVRMSRGCSDPRPWSVLIAMCAKACDTMEARNCQPKDEDVLLLLQMGRKNLCRVSILAMEIVSGDLPAGAISRETLDGCLRSIITTDAIKK